MAQSRISHGKKFGEIIQKFILRQYILSFSQSLCFVVGNNMTTEIYNSLFVHGEENFAFNFNLKFQGDRWLKLTISGHYIIERREKKVSQAL